MAAEDGSLANLLQRVQTLEAKLEAFCFKDHKVQQESGVLPLDEFDTFRIVYVPDWTINEFTRTQHRMWQRGPQLPADLYFLENPTDQLKEQIELQLGQPIDWSLDTVVFRHTGPRSQFRKAMEQKQIHDFYLYWRAGQEIYGKLKLMPTMRELILSKSFEIEELPEQATKNPMFFNRHLKQFIQQKAYSATITVDFETPFVSAPHIHWFTTPLQFSAMHISLQQVTPKQAIFEFKYGKDYVPLDTKLHWLATGPIKPLAEYGATNQQPTIQDHQ
jgi:hypothetical protein